MVRRRSPYGNLTATFIAIGAALVITFILLSVGSKNPGKAIGAFFLGPFSNTYYLGNMLNSASALILTGLGVGLAFRAGVFNLGGEGQVYVSALATTMILLRLPALPGVVGVVIGVLAGCAAGALLAGLSGLFKQLWGTDELITSFLISAALVPTVDYLIIGPLRNQKSNLLTTKEIASQYHLLRLLPPSHLNLTLIIAVLSALLLFFILYYTVWGYELRLTGLNREFSRYGGISIGVYTVMPMVLSGALHGAAGAFTVMGTYHASISGFTSGYGWNGIAVALIGRNNPLGVIPAALIFTYLAAGANAALLHTDFTFELGAIIQAVIFFFITAQIWVPRLFPSRKAEVDA